MIPTPGQPYKRYGLGAVNDQTGETVVLFRRRKRRREVAELLQALVDKHPTGTIDVAWDNADTHADEDVEAVVRAAAGRLVLLCTCRLTARGSTRLRGGGGTFGVQSPMVSCLPPSRRCSTRRTRSLTAITSTRNASYPSSERMPHNCCGCT
jgi:hypothetical protein